jgi:hypothetical protein
MHFRGRLEYQFAVASSMKKMRDLVRVASSPPTEAILRGGEAGVNSSISSSENVWSLKEVGARNHLSLCGDKSLSSRLRHQLKTLDDGAEDRSSR